MHRFFCDEGELATARAAADVGHRVRRVDGGDDVGRGRRPRRPTARAGRRCTCSATAAAPARSPSAPAAAGYRAIVASVDGAAVGRGIASASAGRLTPPDWVRYPNLASG